jgi:large subunit ribosomal protein L4
MSIPVLNADGATAGEADFVGRVADQEIKPHLIHETVVAELGARRAGTHSTKNRGEVSGGGAKPWRQKGTGRARQGSIRAPHWRGGGVTFGPTPRSYGGKVNRKIRAQAFRSALKAHAERGSLAVMDPTGWDSPSTKRAKDYLYQAPEGLAARPLLVVVDDPDGVEGLSFRNLRDVYVLASVDVEVVDIMAGRSLLVSRSVWERYVGEELNVTDVTPTLKDLPTVTPPPKPKPITRTKAKADDDKPRRSRAKKDDGEAAVADHGATGEIEVVDTDAVKTEAVDVDEAPVEEKPKRSRATKTPAEVETAEDEVDEASVEGKPKRSRARKAAADEDETGEVETAEVEEAPVEEKPKRTRNTKPADKTEPDTEEDPS